LPSALRVSEALRRSGNACGSPPPKGVRRVARHGEEEEESDDEFCDRTTAPVPKWEVLAGNRVVWV
jgi:hypothetical protein